MKSPLPSCVLEAENCRKPSLAADPCALPHNQFTCPSVMLASFLMIDSLVPLDAMMRNEKLLDSCTRDHSRDGKYFFVHLLKHRKIVGLNIPEDYVSGGPGGVPKRHATGCGRAAEKLAGGGAAVPGACKGCRRSWNVVQTAPVTREHKED